jgi:hypothetical protein
VTPNRAEAFRALAQAVLVMIGLWAPGLGYSLWIRGQATPNAETAIPGLLWGAAGIVPLAIVFALVSKGSPTDKVLRGGQYAVLVIALWLLFVAVGQFAV